MNASPTPTKKRSVKKLLTACLSAVVAVALTTVAAAWFAGLWSSPVSFPVGTGGNPELPKAEMWMFYTADEIKIDTTKSEGWNLVSTITNGKQLDTMDSNDDGDNDAYLAPEAIKQTDTDGAVSYTATSLHFGVVDNLVSLKEDNIVYIRLTVVPTVHGCNEFTVAFDYIASETENDIYQSIHLYDDDGNKVEGTDLSSKITIPAPEEGKKVTDSELAQFLQFAYFVTQNANLTPGTNGFGENFSEFMPIGSSATVNVRDVLFEEQKAAAAAVEGGVVPTEFTEPEAYYLFIKLAPRLDTFVMQENLLEAFVPSFMLFDTKLEIELH